MNESRLRWLQYNRGGAVVPGGPPERRDVVGRRREQAAGGRGVPGLAGDVAPAVLESAVARSGLRQRLVAVLAEHGGAALLEQVKVCGVRGGVLTLEVKEAALLYRLRLQWEQRVVELMRCYLPDGGVHVVRFTVGRRG